MTRTTRAAVLILDMRCLIHGYLPSLTSQLSLDLTPAPRSRPSSACASVPAACSSLPPLPPLSPAGLLRLLRPFHTAGAAWPVFLWLTHVAEVEGWLQGAEADRAAL